MKRYVEHFFTHGVPVSIVIYQKGSDYVLGAIVSQVKKWCLLLISIGLLSGWPDPDGFTYYDIDISGEEREVTNKSGLLIPGMTYHSCGIMLPDLWDKERAHRTVDGRYYRYAAINGDWERYTRNGVWD